MTDTDTDTDTAVCPICRGTVDTFDEDRVVSEPAPRRRIVEHIDSTRLRCEGSFTVIDQEQA